MVRTLRNLSSLLLLLFVVARPTAIRAEVNDCFWTTATVGEKACETDLYQVFDYGSNACDWWCDNDLWDTCNAFCGEDFEPVTESWCDWDLLIDGGPSGSYCANWYIHCECMPY